MKRRGRRARLAASGGPAIAMVLAIAGVAYADVGVAAFSPLSADPGDTVTVGLVECTSPAADVRIALAPVGRTYEAGGADEAVEVEATDGGAAGEYRIVVPDLEPGLYGAYAACPRDGPFGFWGSEEYLRVRGAPDTATLAPAAPPVAPVEPWRDLALLASAVLAITALSRHPIAGRRAARGSDQG